MFQIQRCALAWLNLVLGLAIVSVSVSVAEAAETRQFVFEYEVTIEPIGEGKGPVHVFVPLAARNPQQEILDEEITASIPGAIETESEYGNRYWHGQLDRSSATPIEIHVRTSIERRVSGQAAPSSSRALSKQEEQEFAAYLGPNSRVVVDHPILKPILAEILESAGSDDPTKIGRAIYDWVVGNVEYKKVGTGWGNGDTFWACNERYGNCTDFHALFISLARSQGIPARFEIGFPVPESRDEGKIGGYHCWVEFYLPEVGWFPIDASEAFKNPDKKDFFYGMHPADRIHLTTGRDIRLGNGHETAPLNYFVYPHVEVGGEVWRGPIEKTFRYSTGQDS